MHKVIGMLATLSCLLWPAMATAQEGGYFFSGIGCTTIEELIDIDQFAVSTEYTSFPEVLTAYKNGESGCIYIDLVGFTEWPFTFVKNYVAPDGFAMDVVSYNANGTLLYLFVTTNKLPDIGV